MAVNFETIRLTMHGVISGFSKINLFDICFSSPHPAITLWNACPACHACVCGRRSSQHRHNRAPSVRPSVRSSSLFSCAAIHAARSLARSDDDGFGFGNNFTSVVDSSQQAARRRRRHTRQRQRLRFSRKVREEGHSTESAGEQGFFSVTVKVEDFCHFVQKVDGYFPFPNLFLARIEAYSRLQQVNDFNCRKGSYPEMTLFAS